MDRVLLSFTPTLSKKLISKGVAALPEVQRAFREGKILISTGTTAAYVYLELCGVVPDSALACGMVTAKGLCVGHGMTDFLKTHPHASFWLIDRGVAVQADDLHHELLGLSAQDVFIKGANAIDSTVQAGVMLGNPNSGGTMGQAIGQVMAHGLHFIIPVGLEKTILGSVTDNAREMGIDKVNFSSGMPVGFVPLSGVVITEIHAIQELADVEVLHVGSGGIAGGEGSVTLLVKGEKQEIEKVIRLYAEMRADRRHEALETHGAVCAQHKWSSCLTKNILYKDNVKKGI
jgi:hypothetical protein